MVQKNRLRRFVSGNVQDFIENGVIYYPKIVIVIPRKKWGRKNREKKEREEKGIRRKKFFQCQRERAVRARSARDVRADEEKKCYRSQSACASSGWVAPDKFAGKNLTQQNRPKVEGREKVFLRATKLQF